MLLYYIFIFTRNVELISTPHGALIHEPVLKSEFRVKYIFFYVNFTSLNSSLELIFDDLTP